MTFQTKDNFRQFLELVTEISLNLCFIFELSESNED